MASDVTILEDKEAEVYHAIACKALPDYKVGGFGILFTGPQDPDLSGEYFTKATDFDLDGRSHLRVLYAHGKNPMVGTRQLTRAFFEVRDQGIYFTAKLDPNDAFQVKMYDMAQQGKLGFSSGSAGHVAVRIPKDGATRFWPGRGETGPVREIKSWPLIELSLTPTPQEPRARVMALKSLTPNDCALPGFITSSERDELEQQAAAQYERFEQLSQKIDATLAESLGLEIKTRADDYALENGLRTPEQLALDIYMQTLQWQHEAVMAEFGATA
jgi:phage head maturation protease